MRTNRPGINSPKRPCYLTKIERPYVGNHRSGENLNTLSSILINLQALTCGRSINDALLMPFQVAEKVKVDTLLGYNELGQCLFVERGMGMDEKLLEEVFRSQDWPPDEKLRQLLVQKPDEAVPILLRALEEKDKVDGATAIGILGLIGYPGNELAIPALVGYLGADINDPRYLATLEVLFPMGPDVVVPHLIRALLDKGEPYHIAMGAHKTSWAEDVAGICWTISTDRIRERIDQEYALRCCPAVNALLLQADSALATDFALSTLLAVIERAGETVDYVIPALIGLLKRSPESKIGKRAQQLLALPNF